MARIETTHGDYTTTVSLSEQHMGVLSGSFQIPVTHELVTAGALETWQPLRINVFDSDDGTGGVLVYSAYVLKLSIDASLTLTVQFVGPEKVFERIFLRASDITFTDTTDAAELAGRVIAYLSRDNETRRGVQSLMLSNVDTGEDQRENAWYVRGLDQHGGTQNVGWYQYASDDDPATYARGVATTSATTSTRRRLRVRTFNYNSVLPIERAVLRVRQRASSGINWANTLRLVDLDDGDFYAEDTTVATYDLPAPTAITDTEIDITTAVTSVWTNADDLRGTGTVGSTGLALDFILEADSNDSDKAWDIYDVLLTLHYDATTTQWPITPGAAESSGISLDPPSTDQLMHVRDWLDWCAEQGQLEWRLTPDPVRLGGATVEIRPTVGSAVTFGSYDEGGNISRQSADEDGEQQYSVVRVTAQNNPQFALVSDTPTLMAKRLHEWVEVYDRKGTPTTEYAADLLARLKEPSLPFRITVPRQPDLWSGIRPADTVLLRLEHAPVRAWEGRVRLLERQINEASGGATCTLLPIVGTLGTTADDRPTVAVNRQTRRVKETPEMRIKQRFWQLIRTGFRDNFSS